MSITRHSPRRGRRPGGATPASPSRVWPHRFRPGRTQLRSSPQGRWNARHGTGGPPRQGTREPLTVSFATISDDAISVRPPVPAKASERVAESPGSYAAGSDPPALPPAAVAPLPVLAHASTESRTTKAPSAVVNGEPEIPSAVSTTSAPWENPRPSPTQAKHAMGMLIMRSGG
jgi:hypothetical protein